MGGHNDKKLRLSHRKKNGLLVETLVLLNLFLLALTLGLYQGVYIRQIGNSIPMPLGWGTAIVMSDSMKPTFRTGDLLIVRKATQISMGDIVVYESGSSLVVHRIVGISEETLTTKGDANNVADAPFARKQVRGVVALVLPKAGYLVQQLRTPKGIAAFVLVPGLVIQFQLREKKKSAERNKDAIIQDIRYMRRETNRIYNIMEGRKR